MYIYLSSPYTHPDKYMREVRYEHALRASHWLMERRRWVFSPIVHCHPMALMGLPGDIDYWREYDRLMVKGSQLVIVLTLEGWRESKGVSEEIKFASEFGIAVDFMTEDGDEYTFGGKR